MQCAHCPVRSEQVTCVAVRTGHAPFCDRTDPSSPRYDPRMVQAVRQLSGLAPPRPAPPLARAVARQRSETSPAAVRARRQRKPRIALGGNQHALAKG